LRQPKERDPGWNPRAATFISGSVYARFVTTRVERL